MKNRFSALAGFARRYSQREQWLLLFCALLVTATVIWLMIWQPVMAARSASEARLAYASAALDEVNTLAAELEYLRQSAVDSTELSGAAQSLPQMLDTLSVQIGIVAAALEPSADNGSAGVRFDAVPMSDLLAWLAALDTQPGIQLEQINIAPVTASAGAGPQSVNASLRVRSLF